MKKILPILFSVLILFLLLPSPLTHAKTSNGEWIKMNDLPQERMGASVAVMNDKIYIFGGASNGTDAIKGTKHNNTYEYDIATNLWTEKKSMPTIRAGASASVVNGKIYVIGGYYDEGSNRKRSNKVEVYDPSNDTWEVVASIPTERSWATSAVVGDEIYVFGGGQNANTAGTSSKAIASVECYNTLTDTWTTKPNMPYPTAGLTSAVINGKVYLFGGNDYKTSTSSIYEYDPTNDFWAYKSSITGIGSMGTSVYNDKVFLLGGAKNVTKDLSALVEVYDPITNSLSSFNNLTFPRTQAVSVVIDNQLFIIGGTNGSNAIKTVEMFSFPKIEESEQPEEPEEQHGNRAILVVTMITGLEKEYDLSMDEINAFINWYDAKDAGSGPSKYAINKHENNRGPFNKRTDYAIFNNILTFEVSEYSTSTE